VYNLQIVFNPFQVGKGINDCRIYGVGALLPPNGPGSPPQEMAEVCVMNRTEPGRRGPGFIGRKSLKPWPTILICRMNTRKPWRCVRASRAAAPSWAKLAARRMKMLSGSVSDGAPAWIADMTQFLCYRAGDRCAYRVWEAGNSAGGHHESEFSLSVPCPEGTTCTTLWHAWPC
jgi:hypothetical protein